MNLPFDESDIEEILRLYTGEDAVDIDSYSKEEIVYIIVQRATTKLLPNILPY